MLPDTDHFKTLQNQYLNKLAKMARFKQMSIPEISQRSGLTEANVRRMLDGRYSVTMQNFLRLADAIDCKLELKQAKNEPRAKKIPGCLGPR